MDFSKFLSLKDKSQLDNKKVLIFKSNTHPILFFSKLIEKFQAQNINCQENSIQELENKLNISFLGLGSTYILNNFYNLNSNYKQKFYSYLENYNGPHTIIFFDDKPEFKDIIEIPENISRELYRNIFSYLYSNFSYNNLFEDKIFSLNNNISLDQAILLTSYQLSLGKSSEQFFANWFNVIIESQKSLFVLSQYFLGKQFKNFFKNWPTYKTQYPDEFWIAFWSEQIWQSAVFVLKAQNNITLAKKNAQRLPFSFINKDWQLYSPNYLISAHKDLYQIDYNLKNGLTNNRLELWYYKFLTGSYSK